MPSTVLNLTIYRGLRFGGMQGIAQDASLAAITFGAGTTALLEARLAPGKATAFTLPTSIGEAVGEIIIEPMAAEDTADLPLGEYQYKLLLVDSEGQKTGPHSHGIITVKDQ